MTPVRPLVCILSFGAPIFQEMTVLCVRALRKWGEYRGDVAIVTDNPDAIFGSETRVVISSPITDPVAIKCFKPLTSAIISEAGYTHVALLDCDMIAIADIAPLFQVSETAVVGATEQPFNTMLSVACGGTLLRNDEKAQARSAWGINTGFLVIPAALFRPVTHAWSDAIASSQGPPNDWADQPYFNMLVLRGKIPFVPLPQYWIDAPPMYPLSQQKFRLNASTRVLHLFGRNKVATLRRMEGVIRGMEQQAGQATLSRIALA